jgi:hypothetical protein
MDKGNRLFSATSAATVGWLCYWLIHTRYALLDDALIHLRYADFLHRYHAITFDGIHHSFGTSSLLYVTLLAVLRGFSDSALLSKFVSDSSYVLLIGVIFALIANLKRHMLSQLLLVELVVCLLSPMGIRWLTDGMETSLTNLLVVALAIVVKTEQRNRSESGIRYLLLVLFGAALVYLRIELSLLIALCSLSIALVKYSDKKKLSVAVLGASPLSLGALLAMLSIRIVMGSFLPDTALAKSGHPSIQPAIGTLHVLGSSLLLGVGCALCWGQSALLTLRRMSQSKDGHAIPAGKLGAFVLENSAIFLIVTLSCLRDQRIQGVRYVIWALIFGVVANALRLARQEFEEPGTGLLDRTEKRLAVLFFILVVSALPLDWRLADRAMRGRAKTFLEMRAANLDLVFRDQPILASDVGFISYFTQGRTCDIAGLVNGREMAAMTLEQREAYCVRQSPAMLFLTVDQVHGMEHFMNLDGWSVCGVYDFQNVHGNDRHYLIASPVNAEAVCRELGSISRPLATSIDRLEQ